MIPANLHNFSPFALSVSEFRTELSDGLVLCTPWYRCELQSSVDTTACPDSPLTVVRKPNWAKFLCENRMAVWLQCGSLDFLAKEWDQLFDDHFDERILELCRDRHGQISLLSLLTVTRYVRTRSTRMLAANTKFLTKCRDNLSPSNKNSLPFARSLLTQNLYVTEHCQRALMSCPNPSPILKQFMTAELGHDAILKRGLEHSSDSQHFAACPAVKSLMKILTTAALRGEQTLAFMIDVFESASIQHEQHPLIPLIANIPHGASMASALRQHARINGQNHHGQVAFSLLLPMSTSSDETAREILAFEREIHQIRIELLTQIAA